MTADWQLPEAESAIIYQITVLGRLDESWSEWFGDLSIVQETGRSGPCLSKLTGPVVDQPALQGIMNKLWNLNLTLVSVVRIDDSSQVAG